MAAPPAPISDFTSTLRCVDRRRIGFEFSGSFVIQAAVTLQPPILCYPLSAAAQFSAVVAFDEPAQIARDPCLAIHSAQAVTSFGPFRDASSGARPPSDSCRGAAFPPRWRAPP